MVSLGIAELLARGAADHWPFPNGIKGNTAFDMKTPSSRLGGKTWRSQKKAWEAWVSLNLARPRAGPDLPLRAPAGEAPRHVSGRRVGHMAACGRRPGHNGGEQLCMLPKRLELPKTLLPKRLVERIQMSANQKLLKPPE